MPVSVWEVCSPNAICLYLFKSKEWEARRWERECLDLPPTGTVMQPCRVDSLPGACMSFFITKFRSFSQHVAASNVSSSEKQPAWGWRAFYSQKIHFIWVLCFSAMILFYSWRPDRLDHNLNAGGSYVLSRRFGGGYGLAASILKSLATWSQRPEEESKFKVCKP